MAARARAPPQWRAQAAWMRYAWHMQRPDWRAALEPAMHAALRYLEQLPERPVRPAQAPGALLAALSDPLALEPTPAQDVVRALAAASEPGIIASQSGRFFGWVIGGALPAAVGAEWLAAAWDQNTGMAVATPAACAVEQIALSWVLELLELPESCSGALVTGAQMASTTCLAAARNRVLAAVGYDVEADGLIGAPKLHVVVGDERHDTIMRSLRLLGLGASTARGVATDDSGRVRPDALAQLLATLDGPTIVCAQIGNVNTGAIDPMPEVCDVIDAHRARVGQDAVWLHVDGAFGLWARASQRLRGLTVGAERADSWSTDGHKWLNTPYDCGIALVKDSAAHRRSMSVRAAYIPNADDVAARSPLEYTPEFSRRARGFALYAALRQLGRRGVAELIDRSCEHARAFAAQLGAVPGVTLLAPTVLNQTLVCFADPHSTDHDAHTRAVVRRVQDEGVCFMSETTWHGRAAMRISVSNWSTDASDIERSVASITRAHLR
jgi:glutamate/tyrosine decarboxylase-like PLP-dependent enzyme